MRYIDPNPECQIPLESPLRLVFKVVKSFSKTGLFEEMLMSLNSSIQIVLPSPTILTYLLRIQRQMSYLDWDEPVHPYPCSNMAEKAQRTLFFSFANMY